MRRFRTFSWQTIGPTPPAGQGAGTSPPPPCGTRPVGTSWSGSSHTRVWCGTACGGPLTLMADAGVGLHILQRIAGHEDPAMNQNGAGPA
jgi:hypothetical protein